MPEYAFDAPAGTVVRVNADTITHARAALAQMQAIEVDLEHRSSGAVLTELSVHAEDAALFEVDGEAVEEVDEVDALTAEAAETGDAVLVIPLGPDGTNTVAVPVAQLSTANRHQIAATLRQVERAECEKAIVDQVRALIAAAFPGQPARGAVFHTAWYDGELYLADGSAAVLFEDGGVDGHAMFYDRIFHDNPRDGLRQAFHDYGRLYDSESTLAVDVVTGAVSLEEKFYEGTLHERFGVEEPDEEDLS